MSGSRSGYGTTKVALNGAVTCSTDRSTEEAAIVDVTVQNSGGDIMLEAR